MPGSASGLCVAVVLCLASLTSAVVHAAVCGNGIREDGEACDEGSANGVDNCCTTDCQLIDRDADGLCDAYDRCDNVLTFVVGSAMRPVLRLSRTDTIGTLSFDALGSLPGAPFDPARDGLGIRVRGPFLGNTLVDTVVPGGDGWLQTSASTFSFHDESGRFGGVTRVAVRQSARGYLSVHFEVEHVSYPIIGEQLTNFGSLGVTLTLNPGPSWPQCGQLHFPTSPGTRQCVTFPRGAFKCRGPRRVHTCQVTDPDDEIVCEVTNTARAQAVFFASHGYYFFGACDDVIGQTPLPGVVCTTVGTVLDFLAVAAHTRSTHICTWRANPSPGEPNLTCE